MLEHRVQADDLHLVAPEHAVDLLGLRHAVLHAAGAEHLEGVGDDHSS